MKELTCYYNNKKKYNNISIIFYSYFSDVDQHHNGNPHSHYNDVHIGKLSTKVDKIDIITINKIHEFVVQGRGLVVKL